MPIFFYRAINSQNQITESTLNATSKDEVASALTQKGLTPLIIKDNKDSSFSNKTLPTIEKITFCRYVSTMLRSGLSITDSITVLSQEATHPLTKRILNDLSYGIEHGQSLSSIFAHYPNIFDNFFITIVKAGEISGTLAQTFEQVEKEMRSEYNLKQKITGAMMYPAIVFVAMLGIGILMFFYILPQIGKVFLNLKLPLAAPTRRMFELSIFLSKNTLAILIGSIFALVFTVVFFRTRKGKKLFISLVSPIPVVKNLIKQIDIARFCRVFSTLLASGVPITQALEISLTSLTYSRFHNAAGVIVEQVSKGKSLAVAFKTYHVFPPLLTQMIASGEKSGSLDSTLRDLGSFYEEEVESAVKQATQLLEPLLMLLVGVGVGVMILSVITPIYSVVSNLQVGSGH
jgi:type IV pilus assembly protein PilC